MFLSFQAWHYWCGLGWFWNIKMIALPGAGLVRVGPYRFLKHTIYVVVLPGA
ncbi:MAG: isoprenylcysteine carboxylmethyltransferase family protein [Syntrophobacteraceae bacterium]